VTADILLNVDDVIVKPRYSYLRINLGGTVLMKIGTLEHVFRVLLIYNIEKGKR